MNVLDFQSRKRSREKISMVTCYDYWSAQILERTQIDCLLVGDSLAMVMHGHESTVFADVDLMALHVKAVARGAPGKFIVADMPFLATRKGLAPTMNAVQALMQSGANAVKIEGAAGQMDLIAHIVESGVPVMGHLGLTPQSVHQFGGHKVQGRSESAAEQLLESARAVASAGCFALVLECVPARLAAQVSRSIDISTIGIGAGPETDGQVLVLQDMLGIGTGHSRRFVRRYAQLEEAMRDAVSRFREDVARGDFPGDEECFHMPAGELERLVREDPRRESS